MNAQLTNTKDLKWKAGFVQCACGWRKDLGDGFNGYHINKCPQCSPEITTRIQRKVTVGNPRHGLTVTLGSHVYFTIDNCIQVQFSKQVYSTHTGLTEKQADRL